MNRNTNAVVVIAACLLAASLLLTIPLRSQAQQAAINFEMPDLSKLSGAKLTVAIRHLALKIRALTGHDGVKVVLATELADDADGITDRETLEDVATTLTEALRECPGQYAALSYLKLARMVRYDHVRASLDDPEMSKAFAKLEAEDREIEKTDFTLVDRQGKSWKLKDLRGSVVAVNFWGVACPPCVSEIPVLNAVHGRFQKQGLVILAISNDDSATLRRFLATHRVSYPVLMDLDSKVRESFHVEGIPRTFVYDRSGSLVAQTAAGMTEDQFVKMLGQAGLH